MAFSRMFSRLTTRKTNKIAGDYGRCLPHSARGIFSFFKVPLINAVTLVGLAELTNNPSIQLPDMTKLYRPTRSGI